MFRFQDLVIRLPDTRNLKPDTQTLRHCITGALAAPQGPLFPSAVSEKASMLIVISYSLFFPDRRLPIGQKIIIPLCSLCLCGEILKMIDVTAAILVKDGKVLIAKRKSTDKLPDKWEFPGESVYHYDHGSIRLLAYRACRCAGNFCLKDHADYAWVTVNQLSEFDFAPADVPFVKKLMSAEIKT